MMREYHINHQNRHCPRLISSPHLKKWIYNLYSSHTITIPSCIQLTDHSQTPIVLKYSLVKTDSDSHDHFHLNYFQSETHNQSHNRRDHKYHSDPPDYDSSHTEKRRRRGVENSHFHLNSHSNHWVISLHFLSYSLITHSLQRVERPNEVTGRKSQTQQVCWRSDSQRYFGFAASVNSWPIW